MKRVTMAEAKTKLSELIEKALRGEEVVISRGNVPLVRLTAIPTAKVRPRFGCLAGQIKMRDDFDEPLDESRAYR